MISVYLPLTSGHRSRLRAGRRGGETRSYRTRLSRRCPHQAAQDTSRCEESGVGYIQSPRHQQSIIKLSLVKQNRNSGMRVLADESLTKQYCTILYHYSNTDMRQLLLSLWAFKRLMICDGLVPCANGCVSRGQTFDPWRCCSVGIDVPSTWV